MASIANTWQLGAGINWDRAMVGSGNQLGSDKWEREGIGDFFCLRWGLHHDMAILSELVEVEEGMEKEGPRALQGVDGGGDNRIAVAYRSTRSC